MDKHLRIKLSKVVAGTMAALLLALTVAGSYTVPVHASTPSTNIGLAKLFDMSLSKTGVVANASLLQKLQASTLNMLNGTATSYWDYCKANGLSYGKESWATYLDSESYASLGFVLPSWILQSVYFIDWLSGGDMRGEFMESDYAQMLCGTAVATQGEKYVISDEAVEYIRDEFDTLVESEELGYYYVDVHKSADLYSGWFKDTTSYENTKKYINSSQNTTIIASYRDEFTYPNGWTGWNSPHLDLLDNREPIVIVRENSYAADTSFHNESWVEYNPYTYEFCITDYEENDTEYMVVYDADSFEANKTGRYTKSMYCTLFDFSDGGYTHTRLFFYSPTGGRQIVFTSVDAMKEYSLGNRPYYEVSNTNYSTETDNSVNFTGDYYNSNDKTYTYDIIKNEIDNSTEVNESVVNNIVNSNTSTIINNYNSTTGSGSDDNTGDSSGGGLTDDSFNKLLDAITGLLDFIIRLLGSVITLVTTFLDSAFTLISGLCQSFSGVAGLLGDMFSFIPQELIDLLCASIALMVALGIYKGFKS